MLLPQKNRSLQFSTFLLLVLLLFVGNVRAQQYLEFTENKGQWLSSIAYQADMPTGTFALKKDGGFRVLLHNTDDLQSISEYLHGHKHTSSAAASKSKTTAAAASLPSDGVLRSHCYEISFLNANPHPECIAEKPVNTFNNYFIGNDSSKWASNCQVFTAVTFKNIYPNIDIRYYTDNGSLKYDFIVHPGGNEEQIALYVAGANSVNVKNKSLFIHTSVGTVEEAEPYSYEVTGKGRQPIVTQFVNKGNIVYFKVAASEAYHRRTNTLVIDPQLIFSTFTGSRSSNWGFTATYDIYGNFYAGGIVFGTGFPVTNGAFQTSFKGGNDNTNEGVSSGFDIGITKFNAGGSARLYSTYIGGSGNEYPHSMVVDGNDQLIFAGRTTSKDYPTRSTDFGPCGGDFDIIVSKFNASGSVLTASVKIGGSGSDGVNIANKYPLGGSNKGAISIRRNYGDDSRSEVIVDNNNNVYLSSCTQSTDFPKSNNAPQKQNGGANSVGRTQDAVVLKLSPDFNQLLFSTYLGGSDDDAAFVLAISPVNQNIYVAGTTASNNFPTNKTNTLFPTYEGGICDGFVTVFTNNGDKILYSSYFGTSGADVIYGIQTDRFGYPYVMGTTTGSWTVTNNVAFKQPGGKQFISKLAPDLSKWEYSTVFGNNVPFPNLSPTAFLVDRCENVYVSGWGGRLNTILGYDNSGTNGLFVTNNAYQKNTDGSDFYFIVLERNAKSQLYGSFFGQDDNVGSTPDHVDGGTSRFDKNGIIYQSVCANCDGPAGIFQTTLGAVAPQNGALIRGRGGCNLAAIKIAFNLAGIGAYIQSSINGQVRDTSGCVPLTVAFTDIIGAGKKYIWNFGDGTKNDTTTLPTAKHEFTQIGTFKVMLVSIDSSACNIADTSYTQIRVRNDEAKLALQLAKIGGCQSQTYSFTNASIAPPGKPFGNNSLTLSFGDGAVTQLGSGASIQHTYAAQGTYGVKLTLNDTNYCNYPDSIYKQLRISPTVKAQMSTPAKGCAPYLAEIQNTSLGGTDFVWNFGDGTSFTGAEPAVHLYTQPGTYTITLAATDTTTCNKTDIASNTIQITGKPNTNFLYTPTIPQVNTPFTFTNTTPDAILFKWTFGDGDSLITTRADTLVQHAYTYSGIFEVCLTAYNTTNCDSTQCQRIQSVINKQVAVANAFSPTGTNQIIKIQGHGIAGINWRIYNRWGVLVYHGTNKNEGWNGRYKGELQPQDVYTYTLDIEYGDGTKSQQTGDITLLR